MTRAVLMSENGQRRISIICDVIRMHSDSQRMYMRLAIYGLPWMLAHFTCLAMELKETRQIPADDAPRWHMQMLPQTTQQTLGILQILVQQQHVSLQTNHTSNSTCNHKLLQPEEEHARYQAQFTAQQNYILLSIWLPPLCHQVCIGEHPIDFIT